MLLLPVIEFGGGDDVVFFVSEKRFEQVKKATGRLREI
jgi:hypothetical protein